MTEGTDATGMTPRIGVKGLRLHHVLGVLKYSETHIILV